MPAAAESGRSQCEERLCRRSVPRSGRATALGRPEVAVQVGECAVQVGECAVEMHTLTLMACLLPTSSLLQYCRQAREVTGSQSRGSENSSTPGVGGVAVCDGRVPSEAVWAGPPVMRKERSEEWCGRLDMGTLCRERERERERERVRERERAV